ncbi:MAG: hypothetical protein WD672_12085 [Woeseia sp.]
MTAPPDVSPTICALKRRAAAALGMHNGSCGIDERRTLLLRERLVDVVPDQLIEDRVLEPIDKIVALVLLRRAAIDTVPIYLPTLTELAACVNVAGVETVARALRILRCRRWLTVCQRSLRGGNRHWPAAYAIHTAPLRVRDTLYLDPGYADYLKVLARHRHARVRRVARQTLQQLPT